MTVHSHLLHQDGKVCGQCDVTLAQQHAFENALVSKKAWKAYRRGDHLDLFGNPAEPATRLVTAGDIAAIIICGLFILVMLVCLS